MPHLPLRNINSNQNVYVNGTKVIPGATTIFSLTDANLADIRPLLGTGQLVVGASAARATKSSNQSIANDTITGTTPELLTFATEAYDTHSYHDTGSNTSRLTAPMDGYYQISAGITWASDNANCRLIEIFHQGATVIASHRVEAQGTAVMNVATSFALTATQYVEVRAGQDSGGALNVAAAYFAIAWVGTSG